MLKPRGAPITIFTYTLTIGACRDADRLDLGRVGAIPSPDFMNTPFGRKVAKAGGFGLSFCYPKTLLAGRSEPVRHSVIAR